MPATQTTRPEDSHTPTFETVWAALQKTDRLITENARKAEQRFEEDKLRWEADRLRWKEEAEQRQKEEELRQKEAEQRQKEAEKRQKEEELRWEKAEIRWRRIEKNLGGLGDSMGQLIETLIAARLWEKFTAYPYNLKRAYQRVNIYNEDSRAVTDIDILLADTEWVMAVEVKRESTDLREVDRHIKRMKLIREYPPAEVKGKKLLGAFACGVVSPEVRNYAHEAGFFVLELKGEAVDLAPLPRDFSPGIW